MKRNDLATALYQDEIDSLRKGGIHWSTWSLESINDQVRLRLESANLTKIERTCLEELKDLIDDVGYQQAHHRKPRDEQMISVGILWSAYLHLKARPRGGKPRAVWECIREVAGEHPEWTQRQIVIEGMERAGKLPTATAIDAHCKHYRRQVPGKNTALSA